MRFILIMACLSGVVAFASGMLAGMAGATAADSTAAGSEAFIATLTLTIHIAVYLRGSEPRS